MPIVYNNLIFFIHSIVGKPLSWFHIVDYMNGAKKNHGIQVSEKK